MNLAWTPGCPSPNPSVADLAWTYVFYANALVRMTVSGLPNNHERVRQYEDWQELTIRALTVKYEEVHGV